MKKEILIEAVRNLTPANLEAHGILHRAKDGNWVCPFCGNGEGEDGTGVDFNLAPNGQTYIGHCFRCGEGFDVINVLANHYNLRGNANFTRLISTVAEEFNLGAADFTSAKKTSAAKNSAPEGKDFARYIDKAQSFRATFLERFGDKLKPGHWRGLTVETLSRFRVGFMEHGDSKGLPRVIIPTFTNRHYLARLVTEDGFSDEKVAKAFGVRPKQHHGPKDIFNYEDLLMAADNSFFFVVEGEIDAMSLWQCGYRAIAISGCQISRRLQGQLADIKNKSALKMVVLFDDDDAGNQNANRAASTLRKLGFNTVVAQLNFTYKNPETFEVKRAKDANDALQLNADDLTARLQNILNETAPIFEAQKIHFQSDADSDSAKNSTQNNSGDDSRHDEKISDDADSAFENSGRKTSQQKFSSCPVDVAIPVGFFVNSYGIWQTFKKKGPQIICGTPMFISKIFAKQRQGETLRLYEVVMLNYETKRWVTFNIRDDEFADTRKFNRKLWANGAPVTPSYSTALIEYFVDMLNMKENLSRIDRKEIFSSTGWLEDSTEFVYPTDKDGKYYVLNGEFDFEKAFRKNGSEKIALDVLYTLFNASLTSRMVTGAVCAAPLVKLLGVRNAQLHLSAKSGSGKTACIKAAMSIFGDPNMLRQTFTNTPKFIDELPTKFNGMPLWIDELQSLNKIARMNLDQQIYNFENGITRGRLNKDAEAKIQTRFSGVRITSGEQPLTNFVSGQGAKNRVLELDFANILPNKEAVRFHKMFSKNNAAYGHFGRKFVEWISKPENLRTIEEFFDKIGYDIRRKAAVQNGYSGKMSPEVIDDLDAEVIGLIPSHVQMISLFMTAIYALAVVAFNNDSVIINQLKENLQSDIDVFVRDFTASKISSNAERILPLLMSEVKSKNKMFMHQSQDGSRLYSNEVGGDALGVINNNNQICIHASKLRPLLASLGAESPDAIIRGLHELRIFDEGKSPFHAYQKHLFFSDEVNKTDAWFYVIKADAEEILESARDFAFAESAAG